MISVLVSVIPPELGVLELDELDEVVLGVLLLVELDEVEVGLDVDLLLELEPPIGIVIDGLLFGIPMKFA